MQATQSNNASDFFKSDFFRSDSTGPRDLSSTHDRPDSWATGVANGAVRNSADKPQEPRTREQITREQDRRLERSLYEGNSIEAGLSFEELQDFTESERAYLDDSDGSEPLFPYAAAYPGVTRTSRRLPDHDPATVRGAISRLVRDSGKMQEPSKVEALQEAPVEVQTAQPSAFADVARRVWAKTYDGSDGYAGQDRHNGQEARAAASLSARAMPTQASQSVGLTAEETHSQLPPSAEAMVAQVAELQRGSAFGDAALAHDARNLLSALSLYSDLLNIPGVLLEPHRHYAEELKLIAGRSQLLIDRMLTLGGPRSSEVSPESQTGPQSRLHVTPMPGALSKAGPAANTGPQDPYSPLIKEARIGDALEATQAMTLDVPAATAVNGSGTSSPLTTNLVDLLMRWGSLLSTLAHGTLDVRFGPQAATPVPMKAESLERILVNLVRNARAATIAGGAIRIGVGLSDDSQNSSSSEAAVSCQAIILTVDDSGCGMTEAHVERILGVELRREPRLEPKLQSRLDTGPIGQAAKQVVSNGYERGQNGRQDNREATIPNRTGIPSRAGQQRRQGLGLQVVKELVNASGGRLAILSSLGRGTRVEIRWPVPAASIIADRPVLVPRRDAAWMVVPESSVQSPLMEAQRVPQTLPAAIGPDGFSETELRAMMQRLHRHGPLEERPQREEAVDQRRPLPEGPYRHGLTASSSSEASPRRRFDASRSDATRSGAGEPEPNSFSAVKGAIAC